MAGYYRGMERSSQAPEPSETLGFLLSELGWNQARLFRSTIEPCGLEPVEFTVLRTLVEHAGASQKTVCRILQITPTRMVGLIDSLEAKGFVERRQNADDRRARAVHLTASGRRTLRRALDELMKAERWLCEPLIGDEREVLLRLLGRISDHVGLGRDLYPARVMGWPWPDS